MLSAMPCNCELKPAFLAALLFTGLTAGAPHLRAQPAAARLTALDHARGATYFEKVSALYDEGTIPKGPDDIKGWFAGRWIENAQPPVLKGSMMGIEGVPSRRDDPASPEALILATWSDEAPGHWDAARPAELSRSREMLRRGPRDGAIAFDSAGKAAVILGKYDDGKFRYAYSIRIVGPAVVLKYDYEHRRISFGYFIKRLLPTGASR